MPGYSRAPRRPACSLAGFLKVGVSVREPSNSVKQRLPFHKKHPREWKWDDWLAVLFGAGALVAFVITVADPDEQKRAAEERRIINARKQFAESSDVCQTLKRVGGCQYDSDLPDRLVVFVYGVKQQFQRKVANELITSRDLV